MIRGSEWIVILLFVVPTVWALFDALRYSDSTWQASDQNQIVWVLAVILVPLLGPVLYYLMARPALRRSN